MNHFTQFLILATLYDVMCTKNVDIIARITRDIGHRFSLNCLVIFRAQSADDFFNAEMTASFSRGFIFANTIEMTLEEYGNFSEVMFLKRRCVVDFHALNGLHYGLRKDFSKVSSVFDSFAHTLILFAFC